MYDMTEHKIPRLTVDGLLVEKGKILLVRRNIEPFKGSWVLPGGHVEFGETVEDALRREIAEELGVSVKVKRLVGVYSSLGRDPRGHTVTLAYLIEREGGEITIDREASEFKFFPLKRLPIEIGFDHLVIISDLKKQSE